MSTEKTFTVGGTSVLNGVLTYRFANNSAKARAGKLKQHGHTEIALIDLPNAMTKEEAVAYLTSQGIGVNAVIPKSGRPKGAEPKVKTPVVQRTPEEQAELIARRVAAMTEGRKRRKAEREAAAAAAAAIAAAEAEATAEATQGEAVSN